jgi:hypothetical protein
MSDYNVFDHFSFRTLNGGTDSGFGGTHEPDGQFDFRAMVRSTASFNGVDVMVDSLFPPTQLKTTDSKHDFNLHLNRHLSQLKGRGCVVHSVTVQQGGFDVYTFQP